MNAHSAKKTFLSLLLILSLCPDISMNAHAGEYPAQSSAAPEFSIKDGKLQPENNAKIIPCSLSSHKKTNDFQPRILSGSEKKRLIKKMNKLSKKLKVSISSSGKLN